MSPAEQLDQDRVEATCEYTFHPPKELSSNDPEILRAALRRESIERRRAECSAGMQTEVVKLALDLLVREPDIEGFFGGLAKTVVEESESNTCAVWLLDESNQQCELWLAYVKDRLFTPPKGAVPKCSDDGSGRMAFPCESMAAHLFEYAPGWLQTVVRHNPVTYLAGASAVAIGTALFVDPATPNKVCAGLSEWMTKQGVERLSDLVGAVQLPGDQPGKTPYP